MKPRTPWIIAAIVLFCLTAALPAQVAAPDSPQAAPEEEEFVTVFGALPPEFDPHGSIYSSEAQIFTALYEGLFSYDPRTLEPVPAAAKSYATSQDGKTYTFSLRKDGRWSDGSPVTARDFTSAWTRLLRSNAQYAAFLDIVAGAQAFRQGTGPSEDLGIEAKDDYTLVVRLTRPAGYFPGLLCHHAFAPIHPSMIDAAGWDPNSRYPVNGPYTLESFDGERLTMVRNELYWDAPSVRIPRLSMWFTDDDAEATRAFNNGRAQWLTGPGDLNGILLDQAIQLNPIFSTSYWYFDCSTAPWNDERVRKALILLLPLDSVRDPESYLVPATTLILPLRGYQSAKGIEEGDREEALRLLEAAGYPDGKGLPALRILYADGNDNRRLVGLFKTAWESLPGIKVETVPLQHAEYYSSVSRSGKKLPFTLAHTTWIGDFADPEAFLQMWTPGSPLNEAGFKDPAFDAAMKKSYSSEGKARLELLAEAETILLSKAALLPIQHGLAVSVIDLDYIEGWYQNALDIHPYKYLNIGVPSAQPNVADSAAGGSAAL